VRIKTTTLAAGPAGIVPADTEMEVPDELGRVMVESGAAVEVGTVERTREQPNETAALGGEERAATTTGRGRARRRGKKGNA